MVCKGFIQDVALDGGGMVGAVRLNDD